MVLIPPPTVNKATNLSPALFSVASKTTCVCLQHEIDENGEKHQKILVQTNEEPEMLEDTETQDEDEPTEFETEEAETEVIVYSTSRRSRESSGFLRMSSPREFQENWE